MGPTRFPYGQALGFVNQFNFTQGPTTTGTAGNISGTATPDVTLGNLFYVNNTGNLQITSFTLQDTANRIAQYEGKTFRVFILDTGSTTFANAGNLFLNGTNNMAGQNNSIEFMFSRGNFYELDRSYINRTEALAVTIGSAGSINVDGASLVVVTGTAATSVVRSFSGGQVGQTVILTAVGTGGVNHYVDNVGNIAMAGTGMYAINVSGSYQFTKVAANLWKMLHIGTTGIANV